MPVPKAVLFDYGLVLTGPPDPAAWNAMKQHLGMAEAEFHPAYWAPRHGYDEGRHTAAAYWNLVAGSALTPASLQQLIDADTTLWTQPNQPMIDWAARLQHAGIPTGILSNLGDAMEAGVRECCPWLERFNHLTFSHRLGFAKPDPAIYAAAAAGLRTNPADILFIDDREDNIAGAAAAGMQTLRYTDHPAFLRTMNDRGLNHLLLTP